MWTVLPKGKRNEESLINIQLTSKKYAATAGLMWILGTLGYAYGYGVEPKYRLFGEALYVPAQWAWIYGIYCAGRALYTGSPIQ